MPHPIDSPAHWNEDFSPADAELDALYAQVLEAGHPFAIDEMAALLIRWRVEKAMAVHEARSKADGSLYQPSDRFEKGQKLIFPALDGATGTVKAVRPGNNPAYGPYEVIRVAIGSREREFAAGLETDHALSVPAIDLDPDALVDEHTALVAPQLATILARDAEWVLSGDRWILRGLLPEINAGHINLAEAIIMLAGEPLPASQVITELDMDEAVPEETRALALSLALAEDERFRNAGAIEAPLWALAGQG